MVVFAIATFFVRKPISVFSLFQIKEKLHVLYKVEALNDYLVSNPTSISALNKVLYPLMILFRYFPNYPISNIMHFS